MRGFPPRPNDFFYPALGFFSRPTLIKPLRIFGVTWCVLKPLPPHKKICEKIQGGWMRHFSAQAFCIYIFLSHTKIFTLPHELFPLGSCWDGVKCKPAPQKMVAANLCNTKKEANFPWRDTGSPIMEVNFSDRQNDAMPYKPTLRVQGGRIV